MNNETYDDQIPGGLPVTMHSKVEGHSVFTMGRGEAFSKLFSKCFIFRQENIFKIL
jgi:hypothetical protein